MMKVFICPNCGRLTTASRRKEVTCMKCEGVVMARAKITFTKYAEMDEQQRKDYSDSWLYIHKKGKME